MITIFDDDKNYDDDGDDGHKDDHKDDDVDVDGDNDADRRTWPIALTRFYESNQQLLISSLASC